MHQCKIDESCVASKTKVESISSQIDKHITDFNDPTELDLKGRIAHDFLSKSINQVSSGIP